METITHSNDAIADLIDTIDWSQGDLGPIEEWSVSLKCALKIILASDLPMVILWGDKQNQLYNANFKRLMLSGHDDALGMPLDDCWSHFIDKESIDFKGILTRGNSVQVDNILVRSEDEGCTTERFYSFNLSPIKDNQSAKGVLVSCQDTTDENIQRRRFNTLSKLAFKKRKAISTEESYKQISEVFEDNSSDIPFSLFYKLNDDRTQATLVYTSGLSMDSIKDFHHVDLEDDSLWSINKTLKEGEPYIVSGISERLTFPEGQVSVTPEHALILPVQKLTENQPNLVVVFILNPCIAPNNEYKDFLRLVTTQLGNSLSEEQSEKKTIDQLQDVLMQAPAFIAILSGPDHIVELCNDMYMKLVGKDRNIIGKSIDEALPEVKEQGFIDLLDNVYKTGKTFVGNEVSVELNRYENGDLETLILSFIYHPYRNEHGKIQGIFVHGIDVTELAESKKHAEELAAKLNEQTQIFDIILSSIPEYVYVFDKEGKFEYANQALLDLWGKSIDDVIGKGFVELGYTEELVKLHTWQIAKVVETKQALTGQNAYTNDYGNEGYYQYTFTPILTLEGNVERIVGSTHDITEQKLTEHLLKQQEEYYRDMTNNTPVITWVSNADAQFTFFNKPWYDYTGQEPKSSLNKGWQDMIHAQDLEKFLDVFLKAHVQRNPFSVEFRIKGEDGNYHWFVNSGLPKFDHSNNFEGFIGSTLDIHEQKLIEHALKYQNSLFDAQQKVSPLGTLIVSPEGKMLSYNDQFIEMWNVPASVQQSKLDDDALKAAVSRLENPEGFVEKIKEVYRNKARSNEKLKFRDGKVLERFGSPIGDGSEGTYYGYVWFFLDITLQEKLARQKDDFIGIAGHELKTPITSIKAYNELLKERFKPQGDDMSDMMFGKIDKQINKLVSLISDLLDITKIEQGQLRFLMEKFDFDLLVKEIVEDIQRTTTTHHLEIYTSGEGRREIAGDRERLGQVIINFLTNSIKYSPDADQVNVGIQHEPDQIIFSVQDFGFGLPEESRKKVFDRFYRVQGRKHDAQPGMGLGLYISASIIKRHSGKIWVESSEGVGSTFYFSIPFDVDENPS